MDPQTPAEVLGQAETPDLPPAEGIGYKSHDGGVKDPVLLDKPNSTVHGMIF